MGSGSLHDFKNIFKITISQVSIETVWKQVDFNVELFIFFSPSLIPFKTDVSRPYLRPFFLPGTGAGT
jgi:hypothetical protein